MEFTIDEHSLLSRGLQALIEEQEDEIAYINDLTEQDTDFQHHIRRYTNRGKTCTLQEYKTSKIQRIQKKITEIEYLKKKISSSNNRLLVIPSNIQLHLRDY